MTRNGDTVQLDAEQLTADAIYAYRAGGGRPAKIGSAAQWGAVVRATLKALDSTGYDVVPRASSPSGMSKENP